MAGFIRRCSPCRMREFLLLCFLIIAVARRDKDSDSDDDDDDDNDDDDNDDDDDDNKKNVNWEQWGPCSGTCGAGQRSRSGCMKGQTPCPKGHQTTEMEDCSAVFACSSTSFSIQESSPIAKTSNTVTSSVKMSLQPSSLAVASMALTTSQIKVSSTPLIQPSSSKEMTSLAAMSLILASTALISTLNSAEMTSPLVITPSPSLLVLPSSTQMTPSSIRASTSTSPAPMIKSSPVPELLSSSTKQIQRSSENVNYEQGGITVLQGYFTVKKDRVLLNHVIRKIRTSSAIDCAMFCLRRPKCQSFNFDRTSEGSKQCDDVKSNRCPNCELNSAKHLAHAKDFIPREGYYYYHYKITQD